MSAGVAMNKWILGSVLGLLVGCLDSGLGSCPEAKPMVLTAGSYLATEVSDEGKTPHVRASDRRLTIDSTGTMLMVSYTDEDDRDIVETWRVTSSSESSQ